MIVALLVQDITIIVALFKNQFWGIATIHKAVCTINNSTKVDEQVRQTTLKAPFYISYWMLWPPCATRSATRIFDMATLGKAR